MRFPDRCLVLVLRTEVPTPTAHLYGVTMTVGLGDAVRTTWYTACGRKAGRLAARLPWRHARLFCRPCNKCTASTGS